MHLEWHPPVEARGRSPLKGARVVQVKVQYNGLCKFKYDFTRSNTRTTTLTCHKMKNRQHTKSHTHKQDQRCTSGHYIMCGNSPAPRPCLRPQQAQPHMHMYMWHSADVRRLPCRQARLSPGLIGFRQPENAGPRQRNAVRLCRQPTVR